MMPSLEREQAATNVRLGIEDRQRQARAPIPAGQIQISDTESDREEEAPFPMEREKDGKAWTEVSRKRRPFGHLCPSV